MQCHCPPWATGALMSHEGHGTVRGKGVKKRQDWGHGGREQGPRARLWGGKGVGSAWEVLEQVKRVRGQSKDVGCG